MRFKQDGLRVHQLDDFERKMKKKAGFKYLF